MKTVFVFTALALAAVSACAQENTPPASQRERNQVYVGGGVVVTRKTTVNDVKYEPTSAGDYEVSYRYRLTKHIAAQGDYDLFINTQKYLAGGDLTSVGVYTHAATASAVVTFGNPLSKRFESFITAGGGALIFEPRNEASLNRQSVGQFSIGGGDDFLLSQHLRIRAQIKGIMYKAPDFGISGVHTDKYVQTVLPTIGIAYSF